MSEYIIDYPTYPTFAQLQVLQGRCREEIVRCCDCQYYREHKWFEVVVGTPLGTDISDVCMLFADGCKVEPDGFCAWAKRKEVE